MARAGLSDDWTCLFANDIDHKKASAYKANWGEEDLKVEDVARLTTAHLPKRANLIWASFPCQDLSLAGNNLGLDGPRSGTFWPFWGLVKELRSERRGPELIVLENVCGALTSHQGRDFRTIIEAMRIADYRVGAMVIDAALFLPHSRPRLFIIGVRRDIAFDSALTLSAPKSLFHNGAIRTAYNSLPHADKLNWIWWNLPAPPKRKQVFSDVLDNAAPRHTSEETEALLRLMLPLHRSKIDQAKKLQTRVVGTAYKRTRADTNGVKAQRAEVRFDDVAGCLRTPGGGSSRQSVIVVEGSKVWSRLLTPLEAARLMGFDGFVLPANYNEAYRLMGDGVAVPVVSHISVHILIPLLQGIEAIAEPPFTISLEKTLHGSGFGDRFCLQESCG